MIARGNAPLSNLPIDVKITNHVTTGSSGGQNDMRAALAHSPPPLSTRRRPSASTIPIVSESASSEDPP